MSAHIYESAAQIRVGNGPFASHVVKAERCPLPVQRLERLRNPPGIVSKLVSEPPLLFGDVVDFRQEIVELADVRALVGRKLDEHRSATNYRERLGHLL